MSLQYYIPYLNFILPENSPRKIHFTLQSLSIAALTKSRGLFEMYVKNIPPSLFPIILQTLIHQCYRKFQKQRINFQADSIYSIVHFWPYEVLVLRDHLKINGYLGIYEGCNFFRVNLERFLIFFDELVKAMVQAFIFEKFPINMKKRRIRHLDVSGIGVTVQRMLLRYNRELCSNEELKTRMQSNIYELVCDVSLGDKSDIEILYLCEGFKSDKRSSGYLCEGLKSEKRSSGYLCEGLKSEKRSSGYLCEGLKSEKRSSGYLCEGLKSEKRSSGYLCEGLKSEKRSCGYLCEGLKSEKRSSGYLCEGFKSDKRSCGLRVICESIALLHASNDEQELIKLYGLAPPKFTELHLPDPTRFFRDIIEALPKTLEGLKMSYSFGVECSCKQLQFISQFHDLHHLDLSGTFIRGRWSILGDLKRGLTCLRLSGCRVQVTDFPFLHRHSQTLELIDLSSNSFDTEEAFRALSLFICSLNKVQVIDLESCKLHRVRSSLFVLFLKHFVKCCPKVEVLRLWLNGFSRRFLLQHLVALGAKESLRVLSLSFPSESYTHDDYNVIQKNLCSMNESFKEQVEEFPNCQLKVEWKEHVSLAHWFYYDADHALGLD